MTTKELIDAAQPITLDAVRQQPPLHFTEVTATNYIRTNAVRKVIGLAKDDKGDVSAIVSSGVRKSRFLE